MKYRFAGPSERLESPLYRSLTVVVTTAILLFLHRNHIFISHDAMILHEDPICHPELVSYCSNLIKSMTKNEIKGKHYDCSIKNIFLFSYRRSGTHMNINQFRYGFPTVRVWKMNHVSCANCTFVRALEPCGIGARCEESFGCGHINI